MAKVRMAVDTSSSEYAPGVPLRVGEVHDVPDHLAAHWHGNGLARHVHENTKTTAERRQEEAAELAQTEDDETFGAAARAAGPPDEDDEHVSPLASFGREPLNRPPTEDERRTATQDVIGSPPAADEDEAPRRGPGRPRGSGR